MRVEAVTIGFVLAAAVLFVAVSGIIALILAPGPVSVEGGALAFGVFVVAGILPATLFFAPLYTILNVPGTRGLFVAGLIGALPGIGMVIAHPEFTYPGYIGVIAGALVATCTHVVMAKWREP